MTTADRSVTSIEQNDLAEEAAVFRKITWRILPLLATCWVVNWIDRINIGFARLGFEKSLGVTTLQFGLIVGVYSIGYLLLEVPSNLLMQRIGAKKTLSRILFAWGIVTIATAFARTADQLVVARVLLGAAEAGFFPGALLYLSYWYPSRYRARATSRFIIANAVAGVIGAPISGLILSRMGGLLHLEGWQWLFILEGAPPLILAAAVWLWLSDRPNEAGWLTERERMIVSRALESDNGGAVDRHKGFSQAVSDPRLYLLAAGFCCAIMCAGNVVQVWAPSIIRNAGTGNLLKIGVFAAVPWAVAIAVMLMVSFHSDLRRERRWHFVACAIVVAISLGILPFVAHSSALAVIALTVMTSAYLSSIAIFWTIPSLYFSPGARAGALALINTLGQFGALFTPLLIGWAATKTGNLAIGVSVVGAIVAVGALAVALAFPKGLLKESAAAGAA